VSVFPRSDTVSKRWLCWTSSEPCVLRRAMLYLCVYTN